MAKLYWRVKLNGKWTWRPAHVHEKTSLRVFVKNYDPKLETEEEE